MNDSNQYGSCRRRSKRAKHKSKVWNRVTWFSKKSRPPKSTHDNLSPEGPLSDDGDCSSTWSATSPHTCRLYRSSSENDIFETDDGAFVKRSKRYPNSEMIEQNCLRPSVVKALFMQLDGLHLNGNRRPRCSRRIKPKHADDPDNTFLSRCVSDPEELTTARVCHCIACCSCSVSDRLNGVCPVYMRKGVSTASLDRGMADFENATHCYGDILIEDIKQASTLPKVSKTYGNDSNKCILSPTLSNQLDSRSQSAFPAYGPNATTTLDVMDFSVHEDEICDMTAMSCAAINSSPCVIQNEGCSTHTQCLFDNIDHTTEINTETVSIDLINPEANQRETSITTDRTTPTSFKHKADSIEQWFCSFTNEQKNVILQRLLLHCSVPQTHMVCEQLGTYPHPGCPANCQDRIRWLPQSLVLIIFSLLDPVSLCRASGVCQAWYELANEPTLWRKFCSQPKWKLSRNGEQKQIIQHISPCSTGAVHWKRVFAERYRLRDNWMKGRCTVRTFEGHTQGVSCVQFDDTRIVSGSSDKNIKVWNIRTNNPWSVQTFPGHSDTVRCLHLDGNRLVSGSTDKTIKVWDLATQQSWSSIACKVTMTGHCDTVRCLQVDDDKVISGSYDQTLKIWDIRTGRCRKTLRGHEAAVLCVRFDKSKIVSGSCDKTIKVWNFEGDCVRTLQGHQDAVTCLQFDSQRIVSGSLDCNLKFWDIHTGECLNTIDWKASEGHTGVVRCLQADSWRVVSASDDRTLKVWSLETGKRLVTLRNHEDGVTCLQFNDSMIVSGSYDKTVKLWDFSSV